jgi:hypothetical protein
MKTLFAAVVSGIFLLLVVFLREIHTMFFL